MTWQDNNVTFSYGNLTFSRNRSRQSTKIESMQFHNGLSIQPRLHDFVSCLMKGEPSANDMDTASKALG